MLYNILSALVENNKSSKKTTKKTSYHKKGSPKSPSLYRIYWDYVHVRRATFIYFPDLRVYT